MSPEEIVNFALHRDFGDGLAMVQRVASGASVVDEAAALGVALPPGFPVATAREDAHVLDRALKSAFFEPVDLPHQVQGPPPDALATVQAELVSARGQASEVEERRQALSDEVADELRRTLALVRLDLELCEALRWFPCREGVYVVSGWVPERRADDVEDRVRTVASGQLVIETLPPAAGRRSVPSLIRYPPWLRLEQERSEDPHA